MPIILNNACSSWHRLAGDFIFGQARLYIGTLFEVMDAQTGELDFVLETAKLDDVSDEPTLVTNSFTNMDQQGELTYGYAVSRQMVSGSTMDDDKVKLSLGDGSFSQYIKSLDLGEMVRYDYVPDFQSALYAPEKLASMLAED